MDSGVPRHPPGLTADSRSGRVTVLPLLADAAHADNGCGDTAADAMTFLHDRHAEDAASREGVHAQAVAGLLHQLLAPLAGGAAFALLVGPDARHWLAFLLGFVAFAGSALVVGRERRWTALLPFMAGVTRLSAPLLGGAALALLALGIHLRQVDVHDVLGAAIVAAAFEAAGSRIARTYVGGERPSRVAVIGSTEVATSLARELAVSRTAKHVVVGRIATTPEGPTEIRDEVPTLGELRQVGALVEKHAIDLLVMTGEAPRLDVFNEIAAACLHLPVRLWELASFYEDVFGHVPVAEINASWFQYIMHPRYRSSPPASKRVIDLAVALAVGVLTAPLMAVLMLLIRRDGGPALFTQTRIGEGGRPFTVYKLRTMRLGAPSAAQWAEADDPRVTRIGRFLRRTHIDEIPQWVNVVKGEMSLVGPRPEQPEFVERLEQWVPYYTRRHLMKPGITGWAQVRCGYAGSDVGSAWKLCHDLYYLKHRSITLDLVIIGETLRTLIADRQYSVEPNSVSFIVNDRELGTAEPEPAIASS